MRKVITLWLITTNFLTLLVFLLLLGCETPSLDPIPSVPHGYTLLDQHNPKDKQYFQAIENSLKNLGTLQFAFAKSNELILYREGGCPYPTNYGYQLKANPLVSLEDIKQANLDLQ